jgi:lysophospholipase L1-like esterase
MMSRRAFVARVAFLALAVTLSAAILAIAIPLPQGTRVVFLGDSITEQLAYTRYAMDYFALRYPDVKITFRNAGWSGDTAPGGLERLQRDVLSLKPTVVTICFGMNDGRYTSFDQDRYDRYMKGMTGLVQMLKGNGIRVVLLTPGVVDEDIDNKGYNQTLTRYAQGVKELAASEQVAVSDINALMGDAQARAKHDDPKFTMIPDSVHPDPPGQALMAYGLLKAVGADQPAASVTIDAATRGVATDRAVVKNLRVTPQSVTFTRIDRAFPTYFDPEAATVFAYAPIQQELNQYPFRVIGLQPGDWKLTVDNVEVGAFSAEDLAKGVDLATRPGPWQKLGEQVNHTVATQEWIYRTRWKQLGVLLSVPDEAQPEKLALERKLDQCIAEQESERAKLVTPHAWRWQLAHIG